MADDLFSSLAEALRLRLSTIADHALRESDPAAQLEQLKTVSERIAQLGSELPSDTSPQLRHYLLRCSYDKALAHLESGLR